MEKRNRVLTVVVIALILTISVVSLAMNSRALMNDDYEVIELNAETDVSNVEAEIELPDNITENGRIEGTLTFEVTDAENLTHQYADVYAEIQNEKYHAEEYVMIGESEELRDIKLEEDQEISFTIDFEDLEEEEDTDIELHLEALDEEKNEISSDYHSDTVNIVEGHDFAGAKEIVNMVMNLIISLIPLLIVVQILKVIMGALTGIIP